MLGRIVRVRDATRCWVTAFDVAIEDEGDAIAAVKLHRPALAACHLQADEILSPTAIAFLDLQPDEIRERHPLPSSRSETVHQ